MDKGTPAKLMLNEAHCGKLFTPKMACKIVKILRQRGWDVAYVRHAYKARPWLFVTEEQMQAFHYAVSDAITAVLQPLTMFNSPEVYVLEDEDFEDFEPAAMAVAEERVLA